MLFKKYAEIYKQNESQVKSIRQHHIIFIRPANRPATISMFFDTLSTMLQKENLSEYLFAKINILKINPSQRLDSYIVQVTSSDQITDGQTNFQAKFKKQLKKGSIIRLIEWKLDFKSFEIIIEDCQYLGGAGYGVKGGKAWDVQKLKLITNSSIISKDFVVLHNPQTSPQGSTQKHNAKKPIDMPIFRLNAYKSKYFQEKVHKNQVLNTKSQEINNKSERIVDKQNLWKSLEEVEDEDKSQYGQTPNPDKTFRYSQIDIENVRKLRVSESLDEKALSNLSIRELMGKKREAGVKSEIIPGSGRGQGENTMVDIEKSTVNEDSKGRQLIFNKEEIKKLLGKQ